MIFKDTKMTYEEKRRFRYNLQDYMNGFFAFQKMKGKHVLEVGSGSGIDSAEMLRRGAHVVSLDFSPLACETTKSLLRESKQDGNVVMADAEYLPLRESIFDIVYSYGVIHHVPRVGNVINEIRRCLKKSGVFTGMVYNRNSLLYAYTLLYLHGFKEGMFSAGVTEQDVVSQFSERVLGNPYTKCYTIDELEGLLQPYFSEIEIRCHYNVIDTLSARKVKFHLDGSDELGWHLVFRAGNPSSTK